MCNCSCRWNCLSLSIIASIVVGVITTFLRYTATITLTPAFLWVVLGVAVVYLGVNLVTAALTRANGIRGCVCSALSAVLIGILGAILLSVLLLAVPFAATSLLGAVLTGLLLFFASLFITATACLTRCIAGCSTNLED
ncbi:MAG: hypothetical protein IJO50_03470 [Clostridia bacterium]|nr:hypothetical protein [Clostridia bacterium]